MFIYPHIWMQTCLPIGIQYTIVNPQNTSTSFVYSFVIYRPIYLYLCISWYSYLSLFGMVSELFVEVWLH